MKTVTIAEFKRHLPSLLEAVAKGDSILLQKGHRRVNVAILSPCGPESGSNRRLGPLASRGKPVFKDWSITEDGFLGLSES
jgi:antitoxin (DNA-binding transcriptional repressor) of toxin-antitoxin stability system